MRDVLRLRKFDLQRPLRLLQSFHFWKGRDVGKLAAVFRDELSAGFELFSDSGAYSAFSIGASIELHEYIEWVDRWRAWFTVVGALDVIGSAEGTARNTETMVATLPEIPILPAFHVGEPWEFLDHYVARYPYIALGGMVPYAGSRRRLLRAWLDNAFARIPSSTMVHGFGLTTWPMLKALPFFSVDSSSWASAARFAHLPLFDASRGAWDTVSYKKGDPRDGLRHRRLLSQYGTDMRTLRGTTGTIHHLQTSALGLEAWRRAEVWLDEFKRRGEA